MMLQMYKNNLLICLALYICGGAAYTNNNVEAAAMLRTMNHHQDSLPSLRDLEQNTKDSKASNIPEWPDDDDDDDIPVQSKVIVDQTDNDSANAGNATSKIDNDKTEILSTKQVSVEQDNGGDGDDEEIITNENMVSPGNQQTENTSDIEKVDVRNESGTDVDVDNTTFVMGEEIPTTEYHRSQSTMQNEAPTDSTGEIRTFDQSENIDMNNGQELSENINTAKSNVVDSNEINDGSVMATFDGNSIENPDNGSVPPSERVDPHQQSQVENTFVNYNEDDDEESFFAMIQSTLQAIQEEAMKVVADLVSWLSESRNESNRDSIGGVYSMSTVVDGGSSVEGSGSSRVETIPLATATDEEWGWDDEDVGGNLELSGVGRDTTTEEDDLAMAIAMSLSEPVKSANSEPVPADVVNKHSSSALMPATEVAVEKSSSGNDQLEQFAPPTDTIEDLLGQMSSAGGPVISTFGQKTSKVEPKPKTKTKTDTDDIFESMGMGLSSFSKKTGPSQQQIKTPSSTLLKAESIDENDDGDDWGDDGDLDDLLFED
eukprot:scaffold7554_cov143-Skeletonema_menzelii.AAC.16